MRAGPDKHNPTRNGHCTGCVDPYSEVTHQMGTFEHPDDAPKDKSQEGLHKGAEPIEPSSTGELTVGMLTPFRCPVCGGNGIVAGGFYGQTSGQWLAAGVFSEECRSCKGTGVVWG